MNEPNTTVAINPEQLCFCRVSVKAVPTVVNALRQTGFVTEANEVERFTNDYTDPEANSERLRWLEKADALIEYGKIEFDSDATISHSEDNGQYVLGWIWVEDNEEEPGDDLCDAGMHSGVNVERTTWCGKTIGIECGCSDRLPDGCCGDPECEECREHESEESAL